MASSVSGRRGFVLLEVVLSLGLLVLGMTVIGAQVRQAFDTSVNTALTMRAMMLAESRLAQLDSGMLVLDPVLIEAGEPIEEDFGRLFPAFATRVTVSETAVEELFQVTLQMLYDRNRDPDDEYDFDESTVLYTLYTLRATPAFIDLEVDFGVDQERIEKLIEAVPDAEFDPYAFDPSFLASMELEDLVAVLPDLLEALGIGPDEVARMLPPDVLQMLNEAGIGADDVSDFGRGSSDQGGGR
ncbi:MAG: hypothetical protein IID37_01975 [Planctomycetes bacterium]|nr:hypothetical protein [Planctomycetota bacterium]